MKQQSVMYFTEKEEEFANLLMKIGTPRNVAKMLVFLANSSEATSRQIERGTDLRQPEVSIAIKYLAQQNWIKCRDIPSEKKGRPMKNYSLALPIKQIITAIEKEKKDNLNNQIALVGKMRDYL